MATADVQAPVEPAAPALPDYVTDPDAVLKDQANWRYGRAPDYSKTRKVFAESKYIDIPRIGPLSVAYCMVRISAFLYLMSKEMGH
jgi:hypothetical protein